jgi:hypothetical protein
VGPLMVADIAVDNQVVAGRRDGDEWEMRRTEIGCMIGGIVVAVEQDREARRHTGCGRGNAGDAPEAALGVGSVDCPAAVAVACLGVARREPFAGVGGTVSQDLVESLRARSVVVAGRLAAAVAVQAMKEADRRYSVSTGPDCDGSGHSPRDCGAVASLVVAPVAAAGHPVGRLRAEVDIRCVASVHR